MERAQSIVVWKYEAATKKGKAWLRFSQADTIELEFVKLSKVRTPLPCLCSDRSRRHRPRPGSPTTSVPNDVAGGEEGAGSGERQVHARSTSHAEAIVRSSVVTLPSPACGVLCNARCQRTSDIASSRSVACIRIACRQHSASRERLRHRGGGRGLS